MRAAYRTRKTRKGLTEDGSTRAWRRLRASMGKPPGPGYHLHHIRPRRLGGKDTPSNVRWMKNSADPNVGRPKGS